MFYDHAQSNQSNTRDRKKQLQQQQTFLFDVLFFFFESSFAVYKIFVYPTTAIIAKTNIFRKYNVIIDDVIQNLYNLIDKTSINLEPFLWIFTNVWRHQYNVMTFSPS